LLGEPKANLDGVARALGRKEAALLAYLTLAGATSRSRAAGLLWPEAGEGAARANLRQLLKRLKGRLGDGIVVQGDPLRLADGARVDVAELKVAAFQGRRDAVLASDGLLLRPFDFDDCPDFEDWLLAEREALESLTRTALVEAVAELEREGAIAEALRVAERLIRHDPIAESAHATAMRLHLAAGERALALAAYERLAGILARELGLEPSPDTTALAEAIRHGEAAGLAPALAPAPAPPIPPSLLRPPRLVGREAGLREVARAVDAGATALITGPAGIGKSRLAEEALPDLVLRCEGLAHDADLPLGTLDRGLTRFLERHPELAPEDAALAELAAVLPGLRTLRAARTGGVARTAAAGAAADAGGPHAAEAGRSPPGPAGRSRFLAALASTLGALMNRGVSLFADDLHAFDTASFEAVVAAAERLRSVPYGQARWRAAASLRPGELSPERLEALERAVAAGTARWITLRPLTFEGVTELLASLELPDLPPSRLEELGRRLHRHTGGNALFIVECLKDLLAAGGPAGPGDRLPMPQRVGQIIRQRVSRLPMSAQRLALAAAVANGSFELAVLGSMLGSHPLDLAGDLRTLEDAQVIHGNAFTHDLIAEALLEAAPEPVRRFLEARAAEGLEGAGAQPALVARHWLNAGSPPRALPFLLEAAAGAEARLAYREAADALYQASRILTEQGREDEAFDRLARAYELVVHGDSRADATRIITALERHARTSAQRATAAHARAGLLATGGHGAQAEAAARSGMAAAREASDASLEALLANDLATALFARGAYDEAAAAFESCAEAARRRGDRPGLVEALANRAVALSRLDRHEDAIALHRQVAGLLERPEDVPERIAVLTNLAVSLSETGRAGEALATHRDVEGLLARLPEVGYAHLVHWANLGKCEQDLDHLAQALPLLQRAAAATATLDYWGASAIERHLAELFRRLGDTEAARGHALRALEQSGGRSEHELCGRLQLAGVLLHGEGDAPAARTEIALVEALVAGTRPVYRAWYHLLSSDALAADPRPDLDAAADHARAALALAERLGLHGHRLSAHACLSRLLLAGGATAGAVDEARAAVALLGSYAPRYGTTGDVLLAAADALAAASSEQAGAAYRACRDWLERLARDHVPPERRDAFLHGSRLHRTILAA